MAEDTDGKLDQILGLLSEVKTTQDEQAEEIARLKALQGGKQPPPDPPGIINPRGGQPAARKDGLRHFDVDTDQTFDPNLRADMWRPDKIVSCDCGQESYAQIIGIRGEKDIIDAQRPVMSAGGNMVQEAHRFVINPQTGQNTIPEPLRMTEEKAAHFRECREASRKADPIFTQFRADKMAEIEDAQGALPKLDNPEIEAAQEFHQGQMLGEER